MFPTELGCDKSKSSTPPAPAGPSPAAVPITKALVSTLTRPTFQPGIIQPGDWIRVSVNDLIGIGLMTGTTARVAGDGTIGMPLLGSISLAGQTTAQAQKAIAISFKKAMIIPGAQVQVQRIFLARPGDALTTVISKYDLVRIEVGDLQKAGSVSASITRVAGDGTVSPAYIDGVVIAGLTDAKAAVVISEKYRDAHIISNALVTVTTLETAPADAENLDLPDGPIYPVPEALKSLFVER